MTKFSIVIGITCAVALSMPVGAASLSPGTSSDLPVVKDRGNTLPADPQSNPTRQRTKEQVVEKVQEKKESIDKAPPAKIDPDPIGD